MLRCSLLVLQVIAITCRESPFNGVNLRAVGYDRLPPQPPADAMENAEFLQNLHHALFNIDIVSGAFICPESGREFPIVSGIPNMILFETEVQ